MDRVKQNSSENIFCSTCNQWMYEFDFSRHIENVKHIRNKLKSALDCEISTDRDGQSNENADSDIYVISGDTLKQCSHNHKDIFTEGCSQLHEERASPDLFDDVKQQRFDNEMRKIKQFEMSVPQLDIEDEFDIVSALNDANTLDEQPSTNENKLNSRFPVHLLSGKFPSNESECSLLHDNQMAHWTCALCNPKSYKEYDSS